MTSIRMKVRAYVQIDGIPVIWYTNLEEDDIRILYAIISVDPTFVQSGVTGQGLDISIRLIKKTIPFRDGFCSCWGVRQLLWAEYRSTIDWELRIARQAAIDELKQEQADFHQIEKLLFRTTDQHLRTKALEALQNGDFEEAVLQIEHRFEHAKEIEREFEEKFHVKWLGYKSAVCDEVLRLCCCFPTTDPAIAFLARNENNWCKYFGFGESYAILSRLSKEDLFSDIDSYHFSNRTSKEVVFGEIDKVFRRAIKQFPREGVLYKRICLFWERQNQLTLAIDYCRLAAEHHLRDDTKNGFPFRLQRLLNKTGKN